MFAIRCIELPSVVMIPQAALYSSSRLCLHYFVPGQSHPPGLDRHLIPGFQLSEFDPIVEGFSRLFRDLEFNRSLGLPLNYLSSALNSGDTKFLIASLTKPMTAALILQLVDF